VKARRMMPVRGRRHGGAMLGIAELEGQLDVTDPDAFAAKVAAGFGRAKAFGCGLMLLRRAPPGGA
jgi:CRISPR system Cascade subunit CasE